LEHWIKKFILSGDISKKKLFTVAWKKVSAPFEGCLGIRSLICLNEDANLKQGWDMIHSK